MIEATTHTAGHWHATQYTHQGEPSLDSVEITGNGQHLEIDVKDVPAMIGLLQQATKNAPQGAH